MEYTANTFGATEYAGTGNGEVYRVILDSDGTVKSSFVDERLSGLIDAQSATGAINMPCVFKEEVVRQPI